MTTRTATQPAVTRQRARPVPGRGVTLQLIGDVHARGDGAGIAPWRMNAVHVDRATARELPDVAAVIQMGDNTDDGWFDSVAQFVAWKNRFGPTPFYAVEGNHDVIRQTPAQWASAFGYPSQNYGVDIAPGVHMTVIGGDSGNYPQWCQMSSTALAFLDSDLTANADKVCFVACHYPIYNTCLGVGGVEFRSIDGGYFVNTAANTANSADILAVLANHPNVKAYFSGHTHSHIDVPGMVIPVTAGSVRFAHMNASCIWYNGIKDATQRGGPTDPVHSAYVTWTGNSLEVRWRNHLTSQWYGPSGQLVSVVDGL